MSLHAAEHAGETARRPARPAAPGRAVSGADASCAPSHRAHVGSKVRSSVSLVDNFGRLHDSLRISVTDRCNIRCFYCMPEETPAYSPREDILSFEEIERFVRVAATQGINKIRLTGGEPLLRRDLHLLIKNIVAVAGIQDVALTTNAVVLEKHAQALWDAGLRRLNIHLDTLDRERFKRITRRDDLPRVLAGIDAAVKVGFERIKFNIVAVKGLVE